MSLFEEMTVGELRKVVAKSQSKLVSLNPLSEDTMIASPEVAAEGVENVVVSEWYDQEELCPLYEDDGGKPQEILGFSWRSEPEVWADKKWVKVASDVDSGASSPVAPPSSMLPNVKIVYSEGQGRGQTWTAASEHKLKNLGQQKRSKFALRTAKRQSCFSRSQM